MKTLWHCFQIILIQILNPKWSHIPIKVVLAQFYLETGGFTSRIYRENKNICGMRFPSQRKSTAIGNGRGEDDKGQAIYKSHWSSIRDYFMRQEYFNNHLQYRLLKPPSPEMYIRETTLSGYAESPTYNDDWYRLYQKLSEKFTMIKVGVFIAIFGLITLIIWVIFDLFFSKDSKLKK